MLKFIAPIAIVALSACATTVPYGNDALPSAEVTAFQRTDARLGWRDARIERDANSCAVYRGIAPDGQTRDEPLRDDNGQPICSSQRSYGNDALPSAEVTAFQRTDARLGWRNARIERDANNCAVYRGVAPDGQTRDEPLMSENGQRICRPR